MDTMTAEKKLKTALHLGDSFKPQGVTERSQPYVVEVEIQGVTPILFHRYDCDVAEQKAQAKKGSKEKKTDNVESYVYRVPDSREIGIPGMNFKQALVNSAKFNQDPRSPKKSATDIFKAGIQVSPEVASLGVEHWDFEDKRGVSIQRLGKVPRIRPAMKSGWKCTFFVRVLLPEYISPKLLHEVVTRAGTTIGLCDMRPEYGQFMITKFELLD
ncbi:MAG: hypothetical protein HY548_10300 [Elusimicrobia bacterium]|nr:hypothetical protein [Elusimicrobiota bacterium]